MGTTQQTVTEQEVFYLVVEENSTERLPMAGFETEAAAEDYLEHVEENAAEAHTVLDSERPRPVFRPDWPGGVAFSFRVIAYPFNPDVED